MAKSITFVGDKGKDLLYYFATLLRIGGEQVLIVTIDNESESDEHIPVPHREIDRISYQAGKAISSEEWFGTYTYVLYEVVNPDAVSKDCLQYVKAYPSVIVTDIQLISMERAVRVVKEVEGKCIVVLRDVCSKRFGAEYFKVQFPECEEKCDIVELWLDSYNTYYAQSIELSGQSRFRKLSSDMRLLLGNLMLSFTELSMKQINEMIHVLMKGVKV